MQTGDEDALARLPESYFKVGTAEIKNWYPVIAAMNAAGLQVSPGRLRAVLSIRSGHRQRDVLRVLAVGAVVGLVSGSKFGLKSSALDARDRLASSTPARCRTRSTSSACRARSAAFRG